MKKTVFLISLVFLSFSAMAQAYDTIHICDRVPNWYYGEDWCDQYSRLCDGTCDIRPTPLYNNFSHLAENYFKYMHTDTPLKIIGIAAPVYIMYDSIPGIWSSFADSSRVEEYFFLYAPTDTGITFLGRTNSWDTNSRVQYQMEFFRWPSPYGGAWPLDDPDVRTCLPVYEAYFNKPITVNGAFYVGGSSYNNVPATYLNSWDDYCDAHCITAHPKTIYIQQRVNFRSPDESCNWVYYHNPGLDMTQHFYFPQYPWGDEESIDTLLHNYNVPTYHYGTACFFPIIDTTTFVGPQGNDSCNGTTGLRVLDISEDAATLTWNQTNGGPSQWQISLVADDTSFTTPPDSGTILTFQNSLAIISNLEPKWYTAYIRSVCDDSLFSSWSDTVIFDMSPTDTSSHENITTLIDQLTYISPNPAGNHIDVFSSFRIAHIDIIATDGRTEASDIINANSSRLDTSKLSTGTYFLHIHTSAGTTTKKLIIKR